MSNTVHLLADAGDRRALCGVRDANPTLLASVLPLAREGHARRGVPMRPVCAGCLAALGEACCTVCGLPTDDDAHSTETGVCHPECCDQCADDQLSLFEVGA